MQNFEFELDWTKGLMSVLKKGLEQGMWFQRLGEKFFVPAENISACFDSNLGGIVIYFHSEKPFTISSYSILTYKTRWALTKEDLKDIYEDKTND